MTSYDAAPLFCVNVRRGCRGAFDVSLRGEKYETRAR